MISENVGQRACAQRPGITLIHRPRAKLQRGDCFDDERIAAERQATPFINNLLCGEIRIPSQASEAIKIGHG